MDDFQRLGAWAGFIGAFTGVIALTFQILVYIFSIPRLKVELAYAVNLVGVRFVCLSVRNLGGSSAQIQSAGIEYTNKNHSPLSMFPPNSVSGPTLPTRIEPRSEITWTFLESDLANGAESQTLPLKFKGYVGVLNKKYYSKLFLVHR